MLQRPFQRAMDSQVRVTADGRSEMRVLVEAQREMAERIGGVARLLERTQHEVGQDAFLRLAHHLANQALVMLWRDAQLAAGERDAHGALPWRTAFFCWFKPSTPRE